MNRLTVCLCVVVGAGALAGTADAAVFSQLLRAHARPGQVVAARVDYWTASTHPPLYLVPASFGTFGISTGAPRGRRYIPLDQIEWSPVIGTSAGVIRFRVPTIRRGRYRLAVYCDPCITGPAGSVIASVNTLRIR